MEKQRFVGTGLQVIQRVGQYVEVFFDFERLPPIAVAQEYFLLKLIPASTLLPTEWARPNSSGPLHFSLQEGVDYRAELQVVPFLKTQLSSGLEMQPQVELKQEHENFHRLVWGNLDLAALQAQGVQGLHLAVDKDPIRHKGLYDLPELEITGRPQKIQLSSDQGQVLFTLETNLSQDRLAEELKFRLAEPPARLYLSTKIRPEEGWGLRAQFDYRFRAYDFWERLYEEQTGQKAKCLQGDLLFQQEGGPNVAVRLFGYGLEVENQIIRQIQSEEWGETKPLPVESLRLQLQMTSAHREMYRQVLCEKSYPADAKLVQLDRAEVEKAHARCFALNHQVNWDRGHLEMVLFFKVKGHDWQEFQRETAQLLMMEFIPWDGVRACQAQWVLKDLTPGSPQTAPLLSPRVEREQYEPTVALKPYGDNRVLVTWNLERNGVESFIQDEWGVELSQVGFYLKLHQEFLGDRHYCPELDCHIIDLFGLYPHLYANVESDRCYVGEIVARHHHQEIALTPLSPPLVTPKNIKGIQPAPSAGHRRYTDHWHHTSQRQVRQKGHDAANKAKVLLHLHMHSPNLFRVDPFRESFLKDQPWPIRTPQGAEVHNPPGEWALKNCFDAWLPLLQIFRRLAQEGVDYQVSLDITPPVAYMLASSRFKDYLSRYMLRVIAHGESRLALMKARLENPDFIWAAQKYLDLARGIYHFYQNEIDKDMIGAFRQLELSGFLELSTCTATHGMPAPLANRPASLDAQVTLAARSHHRIFGERPKGIWLAENSCFPGVEQVLAKESLHYYFVEAEAALWGNPAPAEEEFAPLHSPIAGVAAFPRSRMGRVQVWDAEIGYAGHPDFREYHHRHWGLPLKRITSKRSEEKGPYNSDRAAQVARELAQDFYKKLVDKARELGHKHFESRPLITCSYDAELFGHHWFEGPIFLEELLREFNRVGDEVGLTTPSHYLVEEPVLPVSTPNPSTWGHEALHVRWTDPKVAWTQRELDRADELQVLYLGRAMRGELNSFQVQCVEQMGAELVRAQSSDLTFVIMSGDFEEDMQREIMKYLDYFYRLKTLVDNRIEDQEFLCFRRYENSMFPEIPDYYALPHKKG